MKKRKTAAPIVGFCLILILFSLPLMANRVKAAPLSHKPYEITVYSVPVGYTYYVLSVALAEIITKNSTWLKATSVESKGMDINTKVLAVEPDKRANSVILSSPDSIWLAEEAKKPLYKVPYRGLRNAVFAGAANNVFLTLNPKIKSIKDFKGKRVSIGPRTGISQKEVLLGYFKEIGILDDMKISFLTFKAGNDALRDGLIDAQVNAALLSDLPNKYNPNPACKELISTKRTYAVGYDREILTKVCKSVGSGFMPHLVPAKTFGPQQTTDLIGHGRTLTWVADIALPDDVAYEIIRIVYENADAFDAYNPAGKVISKKTLGLMGVPESAIHPGVLRFFKEKGIKLGDLP